MFLIVASSVQIMKILFTLTTPWKDVVIAGQDLDDFVSVCDCDSHIQNNQTQIAKVIERQFQLPEKQQNMDAVGVCVDVLYNTPLNGFPCLFGLQVCLCFEHPILTCAAGHSHTC
jgi:hypothetical protein